MVKLGSELLIELCTFLIKNDPTKDLYHVAIPTDVSLLSLSGRQSRAASLQLMTTKDPPKTILDNKEHSRLGIYDFSRHVHITMCLRVLRDALVSQVEYSQVFSLGGGGGFWRAKRADAFKAAAQRAERASCGRGLGAQPPAGSRGGAPWRGLGGRSPPEKVFRNRVF